MGEKVEIIPIAIPEDDYRRHIANLVEHLLLMDDKLFDSSRQGDK